MDPIPNRSAGTSSSGTAFRIPATFSDSAAAFAYTLFPGPVLQRPDLGGPVAFINWLLPSSFLASSTPPLHVDLNNHS